MRRQQARREGGLTERAERALRRNIERLNGRTLGASLDGSLELAGKITRVKDAALTKRILELSHAKNEEERTLENHYDLTDEEDRLRWVADRAGRAAGLTGDEIWAALEQ